MASIEAIFTFSNVPALTETVNGRSDTTGTSIWKLAPVSGGWWYIFPASCSWSRGRSPMYRQGT
ncbi:hypothetical protein GE21DRAFT_1263728 [Neurospora crassa]|nr:hypothetical protein GE21DRAFT_1263728 [Neurospora crassa]